MICMHDWKRFNSEMNGEGIVCVRECVRCGMVERVRHFIDPMGEYQIDTHVLQR